jgi:hypothetical protein
MISQAEAMKLSRLTFEVVVDGHRRVFTFIRKEKIEDLLLSKEELGEFLCGLALVDDSVVPDSKQEELEDPEVPEGQGSFMRKAFTPKKLTVLKGTSDTGNEVIAMEIDSVPEVGIINLVFTLDVARGIAKAILDRMSSN